MLIRRESENKMIDSSSGSAISTINKSDPSLLLLYCIWAIPLILASLLVVSQVVAEDTDITPKISEFGEISSNRNIMGISHIPAPRESLTIIDISSWSVGRVTNSGLSG